MIDSVLVQKKLKASLLHCLITCGTATVIAVCIFCFWYPGALAQMVGGLKLFFLVCIVELVLGPLISFVIYNPNKSKRELIVDYSLVALVQLFALIYGVHSTFIARPQFIVFVKDRFELVSMIDLDQEDKTKSADLIRALRTNTFGPDYVMAEMPIDIKERERILFSSIEGKDIHLMPQYYREYNGKNVVEKGNSYESLKNKLNSQVPEKIRQEIEKFEPQSPVWFPVMTKFGVWTVLLKSETGEMIQYIEFDPFTS